MRRRAVWTFVAVSLLAALPAKADDDLDELVADLASGSGSARAHAIDRLAFLGPRTAGPPVIQLLSSTSDETREAASEALVVLRDREATEALVGALVDADAEVRRNAADALGALGALAGTSAAAKLGRALTHDTDPRVRRACAAALAKTGGAARALGRAAAKDEALEVRLAALDALALRMERSQSSTLVKLLADRSGLVRFASARALAWAGDARGRRFLATALASHDDDDRRRALTVLSDCPKRWAADLLARALKDDALAFDAAGALAARRDPRGIEALVRMSTGGRDAEAAAEKLDQLGISADERARYANAAP